MKDNFISKASCQSGLAVAKDYSVLLRLIEKSNIEFPCYQEVQRWPKE